MREFIMEYIIKIIKKNKLIININNLFFYRLNKIFNKIIRYENIIQLE